MSRGDHKGEEGKDEYCGDFETSYEDCPPRACMIYQESLWEFCHWLVHANSPYEELHKELTILFACWGRRSSFRPRCTTLGPYKAVSRL